MSLQFEVHRIARRDCSLGFEYALHHAAVFVQVEHSRTRSHAWLSEDLERVSEFVTE